MSICVCYMSTVCFAVFFINRQKGSHAGRRHRCAMPGAPALLPRSVLHLVLPDSPQPRRDRRAVPRAGSLHTREFCVDGGVFVYGRVDRLR